MNIHIFDLNSLYNRIVELYVLQLKLVTYTLKTFKISNLHIKNI